MKLLKENMLRFGTKNLSESEMQELSETEALNEYTLGSAVGHNIYYNGKIKGDKYVLTQIKKIRDYKDYNEAQAFVKGKSGKNLGYFIMYKTGVSASTRQDIYRHLDQNTKISNLDEILPKGFGSMRGTTGEKVSGFVKDVGKTMNPAGSGFKNPFSSRGEYKQ